MLELDGSSSVAANEMPAGSSTTIAATASARRTRRVSGGAPIAVAGLGARPPGRPWAASESIAPSWQTSVTVTAVKPPA